MLNTSKGPNSKCQFRVRKNVLIEKAPTKIMGDLVIFQIYIQAYFMSWEGEIGGVKAD